MPDAPNPSPPSPTTAAARPAAIDWLAGGALGLLLGVLVGLSASPVVSSVVAGLVAVLAAMAGLSEKLPLGLHGPGAHRMAAFALVATVAVLASLQLRTRWLAPDVAELRRQLIEIEITDPAEQKQMLRFLRFGLLPAGTQAVGKDGEAAKLAVAAGLPVLYSEPASFCAPLRKQMRDGAAPADVLLFLDTGGPDARRAAAAIAALPAAEQASALRVAPLFLCSRP